MAYSAEEKRWRDAVLSIGRCVLCGQTNVQWCHRNYGKGMGLKTQPQETACLCADCHRQLDQGKDYTRDERRALMDRAIVNTHAELAKRGILILKGADEA